MLKRYSDVDPRNWINQGDYMININKNARREDLLFTHDFACLFDEEDCDNNEINTVKKWYSNNKNVEYISLGLIVPNWDKRIGAIINTAIGNNGLVLFKTVLDFDQTVKNKIPKHHYAEMQCNLAISKRCWCDYVLFSIEQGFCYTERVYFDSVYFHEFLYPLMSEYLGDLSE